MGRLLRNLPELRSIGFAANRRMLEIEQISHDCALGEAAFQDLQRPRNVDGQRAAAPRFADPKVQVLLHGLVMSSSSHVALAIRTSGKPTPCCWGSLLGALRRSIRSHHLMSSPRDRTLLGRQRD